MIHSDQQSDRSAFREIMEEVADYYDKPKPSNRVLLMYFESLERFSLETVSNAINRHIESPESGRFMPKIADIKRMLEGGEITPDMLIASANLKKSPLGILARITIGTWNLNNLSSFDLRQKAIECLELLPYWKEQAASGEYTDHQLSIMLKHQVNPLQPFYDGLAGPQSTVELETRISALTVSDRHKMLLEVDSRDLAVIPNNDQLKIISEKIKQIGKG